ncbi:MAG: ABC transporter substrate-binding protein [Chloroflexota bacterium]|nr:MAG: ABC transporter substrate-binding protein [Chloroflexota bacterium]
MKRISSRFLVIHVIVAFLAIVSACQQPSGTAPTANNTGRSTADPKSPGDPISIGLLEPQTGALSSWGLAKIAGMKYAVQVVNDSGGIKSLGGARLNAVIGDSASDAAKATAEAERLISSAGVVAIAGPVSTMEVLGVIPVTEKYHVPVISSTGDRSQFGKGYQYLFSQMTMEMGASVAKFVDWLAKNHGAPTAKIGIGAANNVAYIGDEVAQTLKQMGYQNVMDPFTFAQGTTDQTALVEKLKAANVTLVVYWGTTNDTAAFMKASYAGDYYPWFLSNGTAFGVNALRDSIDPKIAQKTLARPNAFAIGVGYFNDAYWNIPGSKAFLDGFLKANPDTKVDLGLAETGAQSVFSIARAIENAASRKPEDIAAALRKLNMKAPDPYLVDAFNHPEIQMLESGMSTNSKVFGAQWSDDLSSLQAFYPPDSAGANKPRIQR